MSLEMSALGKGDFRQPFLQISYEDGSRTSDFVFEKAEIVDGKVSIDGLPSAYDQTGRAQTLILTLKEKHKPVRLQSYHHPHDFECFNVNSGLLPFMFPLCGIQFSKGLPRIDGNAGSFDFIAMPFNECVTHSVKTIGFNSGHCAIVCDVAMVFGININRSHSCHLIP
jgi:hypothetical protein